VLMVLDEEKRKVAAKILQEAAQNNVDTLYFNGFATGLGFGDITIVLQRNQKSVLVLNASYTIAKTLAIKLGELVSFLEEKTNQKMLTTDQVHECVAGEEKSGTKLTES